MVYHLRGSISEEASVSKRFDPPIDVRLKALLAVGDSISAEERAAIPPRLVVDLRQASRLPDVLGWSSGPFMLSPQVHDLLVELEPDAHDFVPVQIETEQPLQGKSLHGTYFLLVCPQRIDAILIDKTDFHSGFGRDGYYRDIEKSRAAGNPLTPGGAAYLSQRLNAVWTVKAQAAAGKHFWRLPMRFGVEYMCSDALHKRFLASGFNGWAFGKHCREM